MPKVSYYHIGGNPEQDAVRLRRLYRSDGVDEAVAQEFRATVQAYQTLAYDSLCARVKERYAGKNPSAYGVLPCIEGEYFGQAVWGEKQFQTEAMTDTISGINVSAWLLQKYRGQRLGTALLTYAAESAMGNTQLIGRPIWTSIRKDNLASVTACGRAGFFRLGVQADDPSRDIFLLEPGSAIG